MKIIAVFHGELTLASFSVLISEEEDTGKAILNSEIYEQKEFQSFSIPIIIIYIIRSDNKYDTDTITYIYYMQGILSIIVWVV